MCQISSSYQNIDYFDFICQDCNFSSIMGRYTAYMPHFRAIWAQNRLFSVFWTIKWGFSPFYPNLSFYPFPSRYALFWLVLADLWASTLQKEILGSFSLDGGIFHQIAVSCIDLPKFKLIYAHLVSN